MTATRLQRWGDKLKPEYKFVCGGCGQRVATHRLTLVNLERCSSCERKKNEQEQTDDTD